MHMETGRLYAHAGTNKHLFLKRHGINQLVQPCFDWLRRVIPGQDITAQLRALRCQGYLAVGAVTGCNDGEEQRESTDGQGQERA